MLFSQSCAIVAIGSDEFTNGETGEGGATGVRGILFVRGTTWVPGITCDRDTTSSIAGTRTDTIGFQQRNRKVM